MPQRALLETSFWSSETLEAELVQEVPEEVLTEFNLNVLVQSHAHSSSEDEEEQEVTPHCETSNPDDILAREDELDVHNHHQRESKEPLSPLVTRWSGDRDITHSSASDSSDEHGSASSDTLHTCIPHMPLIVTSVHSTTDLAMPTSPSLAPADSAFQIKRMGLEEMEPPQEGAAGSPCVTYDGDTEESLYDIISELPPKKKTKVSAGRVRRRRLISPAHLLHLRGSTQNETEGSVAGIMRKVVHGGTSPPHGDKMGVFKEDQNDHSGDAVTVSDLDSSTLQHRSLNSRTKLHLDLLDLMSDLQKVKIDQEPPYVPHALAFKHSYAIKRCSLKDCSPPQDSDGLSSCPTEVVGTLVPTQEPSSLSVTETLFHRDNKDTQTDAKMTHRRQRMVHKQAKQKDLKRLHKAQMIQRLLQQLEEKQKELEQKGVKLEKALRGEADVVDLDSSTLMRRWLYLVQQKNALVQFESKLLVLSRDLELEDRQNRLQQDLRGRMAVSDHLKGALDLQEEHLILEEMLDVVEQRHSLDHQLDWDLDTIVMSQELDLHLWAWT